MKRSAVDVGKIPFCCLVEPLEPRTMLAAVKIMPLGDSITEGYNTSERVSYRFWLNKRLTLEGYDVDFVGTRTGVASGAPLYTDWDQNHQAISGWRADQILSSINGWATTTQPDVVLMHVGTNDMLQGQSVPGTITELGQIIDELRTVNPNVTVLLAQIVPANNANSQIVNLNAQMPSLVAAKNTAQSPVVLVDQYTGFNVNTDHWDGLHPNARGEIKMSNRWFDALTPLLPAPDPSLGNRSWLSDLNWVSASNGWGPVERDMSNGEAGAQDGGALRLNGVTTVKGLGVHANSEIVYDLGGQYARFLADVGVDDEVGNSGSVIFRVLVDGVERYNSGVMTGSTATRSFDLDVAGANALRLIVGDAGDGPAADHGNWANARLLTAPTVASSEFTYVTAPHTLSFTFRGDVSASLSTDDVLIENFTTGQEVPAGAIALDYDDATDTATLSFPGLPDGLLADGRYRAVIDAEGVSDANGNPMLADHAFEFLFLTGDANHDGVVNLEDFNILAANFGQTGRDFSEGDFNYDGTVNLADFNILAARFGSALPALQSRATAAPADPWRAISLVRGAADDPAVLR